MSLDTHVPRQRRALKTLVLLWLAWAMILYSYQAAVLARYQVQRPDYALGWTPSMTGDQRFADRPYLTDPFMNAQVSWDSEFYLSIALHGYDDPQVRSVMPTADSGLDRPLALNYAFFPVYPHLIRVVAQPLRILGLSDIATATLAGVLISLLGTLAGMIALYDWVQFTAGPDAGLRASFYLLIFPTGFFLAQVYTEGVFIGLAFGGLALLQRKHWLAAGGLTSLATLTRAVGVMLVIPLAWDWIQSRRQSSGRSEPIWSGLAVLAPVVTHLIWRFSPWGAAFQHVQTQFFTCQLLSLQRAATAWGQALVSLWGNRPETAVYYAIEFTAIGLALVSCGLTLRRYPGISLFGFAVLLTSLTCGVAWSLARYVLTIPSVFIVLSAWGQHWLFDRAWSLISILFLGLLAALFTFDLWAG
ncbi:MAG: hypothetical protein IGS50_15565 [Synechococcales cyanobacterium C42_A2020_086]|jgi:hypothetical protein|nr:hypothetical protein [Synechococcales cyanobacterium C42_A2020_086]